MTQFRQGVVQALLVAVCVGSLCMGCQTRRAGTLGSDLASIQDGTRNIWIKSPESIEGTITKAWGLTISEQEEWQYLDSVYSLIGGTMVSQHEALVRDPNELFVMSLDNLSGFLAHKLIVQEAKLEGAVQPYLFEGLRLSLPDTGCFDDDTKEWCDVIDGVKADSLSIAGLTTAALTKAWRKRLMHNIQDIGEFMYLSIDNQLMMGDGSGRHSCSYLLDEVFLPALGTGAVTPEMEAKAWEGVIHTILLSGGFYLEAPASQTVSAH